MVQRTEAPGQVIGVVVAARRGGDHADMTGGQGHGGEQHGRLQAPGRVLANIAEQRRAVGEEDRIELAAFGDARDVAVVLGVQVGIGRHLGLAPRAGVGAEAEDVHADAHVFGGLAHGNSLCGDQTALASSRAALSWACNWRQAAPGLTPFR
ncbi:hypothetical protein D3C84_984100 [compost metagenome]